MSGHLSLYKPKCNLAGNDVTSPLLLCIFVYVHMVAIYVVFVGNIVMHLNLHQPECNF